MKIKISEWFKVRVISLDTKGSIPPVIRRSDQDSRVLSDHSYRGVHKDTLHNFSLRAALIN